MNILIIGPSWVGDMVMAQSLFITLKQLHPDAEIDVLAPQWCKAIVERMPEIRNAVSMPVGHGRLGLRVRYQLGKALRKSRYDQAIVLPNSFKSALIPLFAKIPVRTGWRGELRGWILNDCRKLDKEQYPLMVQRFVALAYPANKVLPETLPFPVLNASHDKHLLKEKFSLLQDRKALVLCPGAEFGPSKKWPASYYAELARHSINQGLQVWLLGSGNDNETCEEIRLAVEESHQQFCINLAGKTALNEAIDIMSQASLVVSNDSGLMHIGAALKIPLVVTYGSTSPDFTPPLADKVKIVSVDLDCSPCFKRECPLGHHNCMNQLTPDKVLYAMSALTEMKTGERVS